ncbi:hypothetical protein [Serratia liquefaciens]|uniref:hypothetical protein n=1 Tax=Serratia liquefaciens TaxID=614 RepID=UPI0039064C51
MKNNLVNQDIKTDKPLAMSYEALKADRDAQQKRADALAVENAELKKSLIAISLAEPIDGETIVCDFDTLVSIAAGALTTPATDAALAAISLEAKIEGANELAERIAEMHSKTAPGSNIEKKLMFAAEAAIAYANGLREAK